MKNALIQELEKRQKFERIWSSLGNEGIYSIQINIDKTITIYTKPYLSEGTIVPMDMIAEDNDIDDKFEIWFDAKNNNILVSKYLYSQLENLKQAKAFEIDYFTRKGQPFLLVRNSIYWDKEALSDEPTTMKWIDECIRVSKISDLTGTITLDGLDSWKCLSYLVKTAKANDVEIKLEPKEHEGNSEILVCLTKIK